MHVTVIGAGAMGSLFGALLHRAGNQVTLVDTRADFVAALQRRGITVEESDKSRFTARVPATTDVASALAADLFLLCVKTPFTAVALRPFAGRMPAGALVLSIQNGIGNDEEILRTLGRRVRIALGATTHSATPLSPNTIIHRKGGPTIIGMIDGERTPELETAAARLTEAGIQTRTTRHIWSHVWQKLLVNVGLNALTALTGLSNGALISDPELARNVRRLVSEAAAVMRAERIPVPEQDPFALVRAVAEATKDDRTSMLLDIEGKHQTEVDAINGAIVRRGERHGIDVAANRLVTALVHQQSKRSRQT
jgi:2-dehydropantoate 2-reductase